MTRNITRGHELRLGLWTLLVGFLFATDFFMGLVGLGIVAAIELFRYIDRRDERDGGDHIASILVQNHPYLGWVAGDAVVGGEAAALGLEVLPTSTDDEVTVNINGSVAKLRHFPNTGIGGIVEKPKTFTGVE